MTASEMGVVVVLAGAPVLYLQRCLEAAEAGWWAVLWPVFGIIPPSSAGAPGRDHGICVAQSTGCCIWSYLNGP